MITRAILAASLVIQAAGPGIAQAQQADTPEFYYRAIRTGILPDPKPSNPNPTDPGPEVPDVFYPHISDQNDVSLGTVGHAISPWSPQAGHGQSAAVVDRESGIAWNRGALLFSASHDLSQYGLTFDSSTGTISGNPTSTFNIADFSLTVSSNGQSDTTAPFSIGVAAQTLSVADDQISQYGVRLGDSVVTSPILVNGAVGEVAFSRPTNLRSGLDWNPTLGFLSGTWNDESWSGRTDTYSTTITDGLNRTLPWSFDVTYRTALSINADDTWIGNAGWTFEADMTQLLDARPNGIYGTPMWAVVGLPAGLYFDEATNKVLGTTTGGGEIQGNHDIAFSLTDSADNRSVTENATLTIGAPFTYLYFGIDTTPITMTKNGSATTEGISVRTQGNFPYSQPITWEIVSGSLPPGVTPTGNLKFSGSATETGTFTVVFKGTDPSGFTRLTSPITFVVDDIRPDIADQTDTVLGTVAQLMPTWQPKAVSGWASAVVNAETRAAWSGSTLTYTASHDLSPYGLTFNPASGAINGTPTSAFTINDFTITVMANGAGDTTAPFKLSVNPRPFALAAGQVGAYNQRINTTLNTNPILVTGAEGTVTYSQPTNLRAGYTWDTATGVLSGRWTATAWANQIDTYVTTISDGAGRTITRSFTVRFNNIAALEVTGWGTSRTLGAHYTYDTSNINWVIGTKNLSGTASWNVQGLPDGLRYDTSINKVVGSPIGKSDILGLYNVVFVLTDSFDGGTATATLKLTIDPPFYYLAGGNGGAQTWTRGAAPPSSLAPRTQGNYAYNKPITWTVESGSLPPGVSMNVAPTNNMVFVGTPTATGTYIFTLAGTDADGFTRLSNQYTVTVQ